MFVRAVLAAFRTRVRALTKDGKGPGPSPAAIAGLGWRDESAQPRATCPPAPASSASLCHRTPPGNILHVGRCRSQRSEPLPGLHSNEDSHRFTDEIGLVRSWIGNFQCFAVELIVWSAQKRPIRARIVRGRCQKPHEIPYVGNGDQGRNRTIHTRIFKTTESPVRCEQAKKKINGSRRRRPNRPRRPSLSRTEPVKAGLVF